MSMKYDLDGHRLLVKLALDIEDQKPGRFGSREHDEVTIAGVGFAAISNEPNLYETFPYLHDVKGVGFGVGLDQMLDIVVNSQLDEAYILDITPHVSLTTRALLEVGRRHKQFFRDAPETNVFLEYFKPENIDTTLKVVGHEFDPGELEIVEERFRKRLKKEDDLSASGPPAIYRYLQHKVLQDEYKSWVSTDDNLRRAIDLYEGGRIHVITGDLAGEHSMQSVVSQLDGKHVSIIYLSNALQHVGREVPGFKSGPYEQFRTNFESLPTSDDTIVITTNQSTSGGIAKPDSVSSDPYLDKAFITWEYTMQTFADKRKEDSGNFKVEYRGEIHSVDLVDRKWYHDEGNTAMGIRKPKRGLYLAGL